MASIALEDADVWDDSALIRSWDQALDEYKKYHSIHARGENVETVLSDFLNGSEQASSQTRHEKTDEEGQAMLENEPAIQFSSDGAGAHAKDLNSSANTTNADASADAGHQTGFLPHLAPPSAVTSSQDTVLQNLLMSWYWTGYYSGFHAARSEAKPNDQSGDHSN